MIDLDSQHNLTDIINFTADYNKTSYNLFFNSSLEETIIKTDFEGLDLVPASMQLADIETEIDSLEDKELILKSKLDNHGVEYDFIYHLHWAI